MCKACKTFFLDTVLEVSEKLCKFVAENNFSFTMDNGILDVFGPVEDTTTDIIKVVGVGGGGCNAVENMYREGMQAVTFAVCNTDSKSLSANSVPTKIMLGKSGHGAGADPKKGREEAEQNIEELKKQGEITDFPKLAKELQELANRAVCHFIPGTLEYLRAGGRVSNAQYIGATLLQLKPLIEMEEGKLIATKKFRGTMDQIVDKFMKAFIEKYKPARDCLYLMYSMGLAENVLQRMADNALAYGFASYEYVRTGCVISCHGGKGAMGLAAMREKEEKKESLRK